MRPDPGSEAEELRLLVALLPVRVRADQRVCEFLAAFFAPPEDMVLVPAVLATPSEVDGAQAASGGEQSAAAAEDEGAYKAGAESIRAVQDQGQGLIPGLQGCMLRSSSSDVCNKSHPPRCMFDRDLRSAGHACVSRNVTGNQRRPLASSFGSHR